MIYIQSFVLSLFLCPTSTAKDVWEFHGTSVGLPDGGSPAAGAGGVAPFSLLNLQTEQPFVRERGRLCSLQDGCLKKVRETHEEKECLNDLGSCQGIVHTYVTSTGTRIEFSELHYPDRVSIYRQRFPQGLNGTNNGDKDGVCTGWPVFRIPDERATPGLRFITPAGYMVGWTNYAHGEYKNEKVLFRDGESGGIVILAKQQEELIENVIMSGLKSPMAINVHLNRTSDTIEWGVQGQADGLPPGFEIEVIVRSNLRSIVQNILGWGEAMNKYLGKSKIKDFTSDYLGYWTDNGAAHYYNPDPFDNYHDLLVNIHQHSKDVDIPIRYLQLDSWWYFKGLGGGIKHWSPMPSIFPDGIGALHNLTGWPILAHNRYFSSDTNYAIQNGGKYPFTIDKSSSKSLPLDKRFWDDLFDEAKTWGLYTYEQDWLDRQYQGTRAMHTNVTLSTWWLDTMGLSALGRDINIQYCMAFPRHALHSVSLPAITQVRVSDDYLYGNEQWRIGVSSLFAHALALKPFKDVFWSSRVNSDVIYDDCENITPLNPDDPIKFLHEYSGPQNITATGTECLYWPSFGYDARYPHINLRNSQCRNPEGKAGAYCFIKASLDLAEDEWEWEYCKPPICNIDCYTAKGGVYNGSHGTTAKGTHCADWNGEHDLQGSYCRNPNNDSAPWCYTKKDHSEKEFCDNKCLELVEHSPELQSAISTLTSGPVGVGDKAENLNKTLIMRSCNAEGLLLKPSKPLTVIDLYFMNNLKEVWTSESVVSDYHFGIIFLAEVSTPLKLTPLELNLENALGKDFVIWQNYPSVTSDVKIGTAGSSGILPACPGARQFCLYYTSPRLTIGSQDKAIDLAILGEASKWTPVSSQRLKSIKILEDDVIVEVHGVKREEVQIMFWSNGEERTFGVTCNFNETEIMKISTMNKSCSV